MFESLRTHSSRKFVDLIYRTSSKYGVWDPSTDSIQAGDFGSVGKLDGRFQREGNIYDVPLLAQYMRDYPRVVTQGKDNVISITSLNARRVNLQSGFNADAQVAKAAFKGAWTFATGTGAVLAVHRPTYTQLPRNLDFDMLIKFPDLQGKYLVTSVTTCPAYASYLASKEDRAISLALCAQAPIAYSPTSAGPEVSVSWKSEHGGGIYRDGNHGDSCFTVLFDLRQCLKKKSKGWFRDGNSADPEGVEKLEDAPPPWGTLDDTGEEGSYCDFQEFDDEI